MFIYYYYNKNYSSHLKNSYNNILTYNSYFNNITNYGYKYIGEEKHLNYYLNNQSPIFIIIIDEKRDRMNWVKFDINKTMPVGEEKWWIEIPKENKFKIYISDLTVLNIDYYNRISTTDTRLIRRIVRDYKFRGYSAENTLKTWYSVNRGEQKNIFPYQEEADCMFNSSIVYELAVLKKYAMPLLEEIPQTSREYSEARRLITLLRYFENMESNLIPNNSLLREFIGGSIFED